MDGKKEEKYDVFLSESLHKMKARGLLKPESEFIMHYDSLSEIESYCIFKRYLDMDTDDRRIRCVANMYRTKPVS